MEQGIQQKNLSHEGKQFELSGNQTSSERTDIARKNSLKDTVLQKDHENCIPSIHQKEQNGSASQKLFSSLSHDDLDKITKGNGNNSSCKKKISQIGSARILSPPKVNVKESSSNSFDVFRCLIDENLILDHDYAISGVKISDNSRLKNTTSKSTSEQKAKHETKEKLLNENENDLVGQIIQNMDHMKPDVISHLITVANQDGSSNADSMDEDSNKTKDSTFFKASHKYTYKNYELSNNVVLQKASKSTDQKELGSLNKINNCRNAALNLLAPRHPGSRRYMSKKRRCFVCRSRWTLSPNDRFCSKCKRREEFPLLKQAQKEMLILNFRSISAPKQRAHLGALEKSNTENLDPVDASYEQKHTFALPKSKIHRSECDLREKGSVHSKDRILNVIDDGSRACTSKAIRKIKSLNHSKKVRFRIEENNSSNTDMSFITKEKLTKGSKHSEDVPVVSSSRINGKRFIYNKQLKNLNKAEGRFTNQDETKRKKGIIKCKKKCTEIVLGDSDESISDNFDNGRNITDFEYEKYSESSTTEMTKDGCSIACGKKMKKKSCDSDAIVLEKTDNTNSAPVKRKHQSSNAQCSKKSGKIKATHNRNIVHTKIVKKKISSHQEVCKESTVIEDDLKRKQKQYSLKHKKKYKKSLLNNSESSFSKGSDTYYQASCKNTENSISYSDHKMKPESSREVGIKLSLKRKPVGTVLNWHVMPQKKKRKKIRILTSDSDDSKIIESDADDSRLLVSDSDDSKILESDADDSRLLASDSDDSKILASDSGDSKILASDSGDSKILASDSGDSKILMSDSDNSIGTVSKKKTGNVLSSSECEHRSDLSGPINIVTYVLDKDSNVKIMSDVLVPEKQKYCGEKGKHVQCFSETNNNSSKKLNFECTSSPESCEQPCKSSFTNQINYNGANEDEHHDCDSSDVFSKAEKGEVAFSRSSEIICLNLDEHNDGHEPNCTVLNNHKAQEETSVPNSFNSDETDESVNEMSGFSDLNYTNSRQKQLMPENKPKSKSLENCVKSRTYVDKTKEIDIIDLSPYPSPSQELVAENEEREPHVEPDFCTDKTDISSPDSLKELVSDSKWKPDISEGCINSSASAKSGNDTSPLESCRSRVVLTSIDETVPVFTGDTTFRIKSEKIEIEKASDGTDKRETAGMSAGDDTLCIKHEKIEIEKAADGTDNRKEAIRVNADDDILCIEIEKTETQKVSDRTGNKKGTAYMNADLEDFQDKFCNKKLSHGLCLMGLPGQMDVKDKSHKVASTPVPKRKSTEVKNGSSPSTTEVRNGSSPTVSQDQGYKFRYRHVREGITLMYLSDEENESEDEVPVEECQISTLKEASSLQMTKNLSHNYEVICVSDDSCVELSDDDDTETDNKTVPMKIVNDDDDIEDQTINASVQVEPRVDAEKMEISNDIKQNRTTPPENSRDMNQNESFGLCDAPILQISSVFSVPNWDDEVENHEEVKSNDSVEKSNLAEASSSSERHCSMQEESSNSYNGMNSFQNDGDTNNDSDKTKLEIQDETRKVNSLLKEMNDSVKKDQCFLNAISELDSVTSVNIIDLELRSVDYSSAIRKAKNKIYEELQLRLNSGEHVSSEELQSKSSMLRGLELLCQKESQELVAADARRSENLLPHDDQSDGLNREVQTMNSVETPPFDCEPVGSDSSHVNEEQDPDIIILSPESSGTDLISQSNVSEDSMFCTEPFVYDKRVCVSRSLSHTNQNQPTSYGSNMQSRPGVPSRHSRSFIGQPMHIPPTVQPHCTTNASIAQVSEAVFPLPATVLGNVMHPPPSVLLTDSLGQFPATVFRDKTVQPSPPYALQNYSAAHHRNYQSSTTAVPPVFSSAGTSEGFISQVQDHHNNGVTFCVACPSIATAVCRSCTKVAYCGETCAVKYWNEVHHKVCMKL